MQLDEAQRKAVSQWVAQGLKLSEIQTRLDAELGLRLTYMEVRLLVDDLKLVPKDVEPSKPAAELGQAQGPGPGGKPQAQPQNPAAAPPETPAPAGGGVSVTVDQLARPGAVVSGKVIFSDGQRAEWYFDQAGRLALSAQQPGYRPPPADLPEFQAALDKELSRMGF